ncbi:flagellar assembly peptidoglycan hydrolase FlgJ [Vreelandella aquamarina]
MSINQDMTGQFALDMQGFQRLQHTARMDPEKGVESAAQQFEAIFVQMMVKSMRDTIPASGLMNSQATDFYQSMLDQQWSQVIASRGIGLADALVDQLERQGAFQRSESVAGADRDTQALIAGIPRGTPQPLRGMDSLPVEPTANAKGGAPLNFINQIETGRETPPVPASELLGVGSTRAEVPARQADHVQQFKATLSESAQQASQATGVPAELILAQAALETGWGRHAIATQDGQNSHNLFGIKAGSHWEGKTTDIVTHEYIDGRRAQVVDTFRVYDSYAHAFTDYASLIGDNPRYAAVVNAGSPQQAAHALQAGGYATDPRYASKLIAVMQSIGQLETDTLLAKSR